MRDLKKRIDNDPYYLQKLLTFNGILEAFTKSIGDLSDRIDAGALTLVPGYKSIKVGNKGAKRQKTA